MEVLAAAVDQQTNVERQQGSGGSPAPGGGTAAAAAAKTRASVQAEVHQEHAARIATEADGSLVIWTEEVHEQVTAADAAFLTARDAHQKVGGWCRAEDRLGLPPLHSCYTAILLPTAAAAGYYERCRAHTAASTGQNLAMPHPHRLPPTMPSPRRTLHALRRAKPTEQTSAARSRALSGTPGWRKRSRWGDEARH